MRKLWLSSLVGAWLAGGLLPAVAQQPDVSPAPAAAPQPPPPAAEPPPYSLDLPDLPSSNGESLFPSGSRPNPPSASTGNSPNRSNPRSKLLTVSRTHGRALDRTLQKADSAPLDVRVAYRRAKTEALARDPGLSEWAHRAEAAKSDAEKRRYLGEYYTRLFAEVRRDDASPAMKAHEDMLAQIAAQQYAPNRRVVAGEEDLLNGRDVSRGWIGR